MVFWKTVVDDRLGTDGVFGENHWKVRRFLRLQKGYFRFRGYPTVSGTEEELRKSGHTERHSLEEFSKIAVFRRGFALKVSRAIPFGWVPCESSPFTLLKIVTPLLHHDKDWFNLVVGFSGTIAL